MEEFDHSQEYIKLKSLLVGSVERDLEGAKNQHQDLQTQIKRLEEENKDLRVLLDQKTSIASKADDFPSVLKQALEQKPAQLNRQLAPTIEGGLETSIKNNPEKITDVIFPIIGPAIRKSVNEAVKKLVQNTNTIVEHTFTPKGLKWRVQSIITGKPFSEYVLAHSLVYRIEHVFLIGKESGMLVHQLSNEEIANSSGEATDSDMVSGMLTAIRSFASDAFGAQSTGGLQKMQVGGMRIWIEEGPLVYIAAVIRGEPDLNYQETLTTCIENTHKSFSPQLLKVINEGYDLSEDDLDEVGDFLRPCLKSQLKNDVGKQEDIKQETVKAGKAKLLPWLLGVAVVIGLCFVGYSKWVANKQMNAVTQYADQLDQEPGVVVQKLNKVGDKFVIRGFLDPMTKIPPYVGVDLKKNSIEYNWEEYLSFDLSLRKKRLISLVRLPKGSRMDIDDKGTVKLYTNDLKWAQDMRQTILGSSLAKNIDILRSDSTNR